jgi:hypothetical protein
MIYRTPVSQQRGRRYFFYGHAQNCVAGYTFVAYRIVLPVWGKIRGYRLYCLSPQVLCCPFAAKLPANGYIFTNHFAVIKYSPAHSVYTRAACLRIIHSDVSSTMSSMNQAGDWYNGVSVVNSVVTTSITSRSRKIAGRRSASSWVM